MSEHDGDRSNKGDWEAAPPAGWRVLLPIVLGIVGLSVIWVMWGRMRGDLWFDEILTLYDAGVGSGPEHWPMDILRGYHDPNNHVLFSLVQWWWLRLTDYGLNEIVLRVPAAAFTVGLLAWVGLMWRRYWGGWVSGLAVITLALSPAVLNFGWQIRGYSLSMLLGAVAVTAVAELKRGNGKAAAWMGGVSFAMLLWTLPTNVVAVGLCLLMGGYVVWREHEAERRRAMLGVIAVWLIGAGLGAGYYVLIWEQFWQAVTGTNAG